MAESEDPAGHVQVAETAQIYEAELIALRLRNEGIDAHVVDQTFHQEPLPNVRSFAVVRVLVPRDRAEEARRILARPHDLPEDAEPGPDETM
jgi:putative signal transducing protein